MSTRNEKAYGSVRSAIYPLLADNLKAIWDHWEQNAGF